LDGPAKVPVFVIDLGMPFGTCGLARERSWLLQPIGGPMVAAFGFLLEIIDQTLECVLV